MIPASIKYWPQIFPLSCGGRMLRADGFYLYTVGWQIHPLTNFRIGSGDEAGTTANEAFLPLFTAAGALEPFLTRSIFRFQTSTKTGLELLEVAKQLSDKAQKAIAESKGDESLNVFDVLEVTEAARKFEAVLAAELGVLNLWFVTKKGGFDTSDLIMRGEVFFPEEMATKVPEAFKDIRQATQCIAFELPTAAAFHLHRAHECVLHKYWDAVTGGAKHPRQRNIGAYLSQLEERGLGDKRVRSSLKDLKDYHRNPIIHPEQFLESVDEAIALMNNIHTVCVQMLKEIPAPEDGGQDGSLGAILEDALLLSEGKPKAFN